MLPLHALIFAGITSFDVFGQYISTVIKLRFLLCEPTTFEKYNTLLLKPSSNPFSFGHVGLKHSCHGNQVKGQRK